MDANTDSTKPQALAIASTTTRYVNPTVAGLRLRSLSPATVTAPTAARAATDRKNSLGTAAIVAPKTGVRGEGPCFAIVGRRLDFLSGAALTAPQKSAFPPSDKGVFHGTPVLDTHGLSP